MPEGYNALVFVRRGAVSVGAAGREQRVGPQGVALLEREGAALRLRAEESDTQLLIRVARQLAAHGGGGESRDRSERARDGMANTHADEQEGAEERIDVRRGVCERVVVHLRMADRCAAAMLEDDKACSGDFDPTSRG